MTIGRGDKRATLLAPFTPVTSCPTANSVGIITGSALKVVIVSGPSWTFLPVMRRKPVLPRGVMAIVAATTHTAARLIVVVAFSAPMVWMLVTGAARRSLFLVVVGMILSSTMGGFGIRGSGRLESGTAVGKNARGRLRP